MTTAHREGGKRIAPLVLEALDCFGEVRWGQRHIFSEYTGYSEALIHYANRYLRDHGLISEPGFMLTERGKIALALWRGKGSVVAHTKQGLRSDILRSALADAGILRVTP